MSWGRRCSDVFTVCCTNNEVTLRRHSPSQNGKDNVRSSSEGDSDKTQALLGNIVPVEVLRELL